MANSYPALAVANEFVEIARQRGAVLTAMQLQKLLYFAHGWYLAQTKVPLLDRNVQAWRFGPVVPEVYHAFKQYGASAIPSFAPKFVLDPTGVTIGRLEYPRLPEEPVLKEFLGKIWNMYGHLSGIQLSNLTHEAGSPWEEVWQREAKFNRHIDIPNSLIDQFFSRKLEQAQPQ